jgi:hypothetical protein
MNEKKTLRRKLFDLGLSMARSGEHTDHRSIFAELRRPHRLLSRSVRAGISRRPQAIRHRLRRNPKERQVEINRDAYTVRRAGCGPHAAGMRKRSRRMKPRAAALVGCATMAVHTSGPALVPRRYSEASRTGTSPAGFPRFPRGPQCCCYRGSTDLSCWRGVQRTH